MDRKQKTLLLTALVACWGIAVARTPAADAVRHGGLKENAAQATEDPARSAMQELQIETKGLGKFGEPFIGPREIFSTDEVPLEEEDVEGAVRGGVGETCAAPIVITSLPFEHSDNTNNYENNYTSANCNDDALESRDVVYQYTHTGADAAININFCRTDDAGVGHDDTRVWVYRAVCGSAANEVACNDDSPTNCSDAEPGRTRQAEIPAMAVQTGQTYYIVADGWNGENGAYIINVRIVQPGACCDRVGGLTCTPNASPLDCLCLYEKFNEAEPDCLPEADECTPLPVGQNCPATSFWGPGLDQTAGSSTFFLPGADDVFGTSIADAFFDLSGPIKFVSWWGVYSTGDSTCNKADSFTITFYSNGEANGCQPDGARPDDIIAGPFDVTPSRTGTGLVFGGTSEIFRFDAQLVVPDEPNPPVPISVSLSTGWVTIAANIDPAFPECNHYIPIYAEVAAGLITGDRKTWWLGSGAGGGDLLFFGDTPLCLTPPSDTGACCTDGPTPNCDDNVDPTTLPGCPPPSRFDEGGTCAGLDPACGMGACCNTTDGSCSLTDEASCTGNNIWKGGVACAVANCPPSNDNCANVTTATGGLPYTFTNHTNGATNDDCQALGVASGWEKFDLADTNNSDPDAYSCYDLLIDYCGTSPVFVGLASETLMESCCSLGSSVSAFSTSTTARVGSCCRDEPPGYDGNISINFPGVHSGDWAYPVLSVGGSQGDYTLNVTGGAATATYVGDANLDGLTDLADYALFHACLAGPPVSGPNVPFTGACHCLIDSDADNDTDLGDFAKFQAARTACTSCSGTAENEAGCSGANNGCDVPASPAFTNVGTLTCGTPITKCGTLSDADTDWYQVNLASNATLTWTVTSEVPVDISLIDAKFGSTSCQTDVDGLTLATASGGGCGIGSVSVSACVRAGDYWVRVAPQDGLIVQCGSPYKGELTCAACVPSGGVGSCCQANSACTNSTLKSSCEAVGGNYEGDNQTCPCPAQAAGDECLTVITLPQTTGTVGNCTATRTGDVVSGTCTFNRSQLTSSVTDPVSLCETGKGGPFAKDGSIWFRWRSLNTGALHVDTCCGEAGAGDDSVVSIFRRLDTNENNTPAVSCPIILGAGDGQEFACDDDTCVEDGVGGADLCRTGTQQGMFANRDFYVLVEIYNTEDEADERETFTLFYSNADCTARTCPALPVCQTAPPACVPNGTTILDENEPNCDVDGHDDNTNNGCSPGNPINFQPIACGQTYCGETANYTTNGPSGVRTRDRDWFEFTLTEETELTWTAQIAGTGSTAPGITAQIWRIQGGCDLDLSTPEQELDNRDGVANNTNCDPVVATAVVEAGRYAVTVFGRQVADLTPDPGEQPCTPWTGVLDCARGDILDTPADACNFGALPVIAGAGRYSGYFGALVTQTPDGRSNCDGDVPPGSCSSAALNDVYWKYTAPCKGKVSFEIRRGPVPPADPLTLILSAHTGCPATCDNEMPGGYGLSCSSFGGGPGGAFPKITLDVEATLSYVIRLAGGGEDNAYELDVSECIPCCNTLPNPNCPECGNNIEEGLEECDDGNQNNGDGCDNFCRCDTAPATCGDGLPTAGEQCEDGNVSGTDGCHCCQCENPIGTCGNGTIQAGEECDDANILCGDGCCCCRIEP